jgi:hypothetical protein
MGLSLDMGLGGSVFGQGYPGAQTPAAAGATPQGPTSVGQKSFGIMTGGGGTHKTGLLAIVGGGGFAVAALVFIWWSLPR